MDAGRERAVVVLPKVRRLLEHRAVRGEEVLEAPRARVAVELEQVAVARVVLDAHPRPLGQRRRRPRQVAGVRPALLAAARRALEVLVELLLVERHTDVEERAAVALEQLRREVRQQVPRAPAEAVAERTVGGFLCLMSASRYPHRWRA